jgi:hypothetical protein
MLYKMLMTILIIATALDFVVMGWVMYTGGLLP